MVKNKKIIIILIIISTMILVVIYKNFINKNNFIEGEIYTNILENTEENDNGKEKSESTQKIIVYITGEINNPGIYELEENSRIAECIERAGGIKQNADITDINLAEILEDGEKIHIPAKGEKSSNEAADIKETTNNAENKKTGESSKTVIENKQKDTGTSTKTTTENKQKNTKVNINTATQTELEKLPGIGPSTATKIIEYRKEKGKFKNIEEIKNVNGIGESKYQKIKELIKV